MSFPINLGNQVQQTGNRMELAMTPTAARNTLNQIRTSIRASNGTTMTGKLTLQEKTSGWELTLSDSATKESRKDAQWLLTEVSQIAYGGYGGGDTHVLVVLTDYLNKSSRSDRDAVSELLADLKVQFGKTEGDCVEARWTDEGRLVLPLTIGGQTLPACVDTASNFDIAVPASMAEALGIRENPNQSRIGKFWSRKSVATAEEGVTDFATIKVAKVTIGDVVLRNLTAAILPECFGVKEVTLGGAVLGNFFVSSVQKRILFTKASGRTAEGMLKKWLDEHGQGRTQLSITKNFKGLFIAPVYISVGDEKPEQVGAVLDTGNPNGLVIKTSRSRFLNGNMTVHMRLAEMTVKCQAKTSDRLHEVPGTKMPDANVGQRVLQLFDFVLTPNKLIVLGPRA